MRRTMLTVPVAGLIAATALAACGDDEADPAADGSIEVIAAFYPLAFAAEQVGGDDVTVTNLTPAGQEPHDLELSPSAIAAIEEADYIVYLDGFMPEFDEAVAEYGADKALEVGSVVELLDYDHDTEDIGDHAHDEDEHADDEHSDEEHAEEEHSEEAHDEEADDHAEDDGHDHGTEGVDPHVWLDPIRYAQIGDAIADGLAELDEAGADRYAAGAEEFTAELTELDAQITEGLANRESDDIVTSHAAFGYLADRYGLHQVAISGLSPDQEASSDRMAEIAQFVEDHEVTTIFFETLASSDVADTIAAETGATTDVLNPLEGLTDDQTVAGDTYFTIMRNNLTALQTALVPA